MNDIEKFEHIASLPPAKSLGDITDIDSKRPLSLDCLKLLKVSKI